MDVSAAIREITDREQIRELAHQYCFGLDGGNLRELADLFTESARLIIEYPGRPVRHFEGRQAIYESTVDFINGLRFCAIKSKTRSSSCAAIRLSRGAIGTESTPPPMCSARAIILTPCAFTVRTGSSKKGWCGSLIRRLRTEPGAARQKAPSTKTPTRSGTAVL
jgi:SnoaL-like domain